MIPGLVSSVTFTAPWLLAGLAALPVIWWLLRLTPPRPETVAFPPTSLLLGLKVRERTPVRSPWWLTALRMLVAAAVIGALAGPVIKPPAKASTAALAQPLLVVVDNGWAAGSRWAARQAFAEQLAALAEDNNQSLILAPTAGPATPLQPLTPAEFRQHFASLTPQPFPGDRAALAQQIEKELGSRRGNIRVAWLADGVDDPGADALGKALSGLAADGTIDVYGDAAGVGSARPHAARAQRRRFDPRPRLESGAGASSRACRRHDGARRQAGCGSLRYRRREHVCRRVPRSSSGPSKPDCTA